MVRFYCNFYCGNHFYEMCLKEMISFARQLFSSIMRRTHFEIRNNTGLGYIVTGNKKTLLK